MVLYNFNLLPWVPVKPSAEEGSGKGGGGGRGLNSQPSASAL